MIMITTRDLLPIGFVLVIEHGEYVATLLGPNSTNPLYTLTLKLHNGSANIKEYNTNKVLKWFHVPESINDLNLIWKKYTDLDFFDDWGDVAYEEYPYCSKKG